MTAPTKKLLECKPVDPHELVKLDSSRFDLLSPLSSLSVRGVNILDLARETMRWLRENPPPFPPKAPAIVRPWWTPMPACYLAGLLAHVGLGHLRAPRSGNWQGMPPHSRQSAKMTREILHRLSVPFPARAHAVALVRNYRRPENIVRNDSPPPHYRRLACCVDLRALYYLRKAELHAFRKHDDTAEKTEIIEEFRQRAGSADIFGHPPTPPLPESRLAELTAASDRSVFRQANALRYFQVHGDVSREGWFEERAEEEAKMNQGILHLLIGPAASGKSSWAGAHLAGTEIVSSDQMRRELTGDPTDQSQNYLVFQRCVDHLREMLKDGREVTFDATNYREELREDPVRAARWSGAEIHAYFFDVSLQECLRRNLRRHRSVPEQVIQRHFRLLTPPRLYEADRHHRIGPEGNVALYWPHR
jgi:predicted kinase